MATSLNYFSECLRVECHISAAESGRNELNLKAAFQQRLNQEVLELVHDILSLDSLMDLNICLDHLLCTQQMPECMGNPAPVVDPLHPVQLGGTCQVQKEI